MILNRQRSVRIAVRPLEMFLRRVRDQLGLGHTEVTVALISDREIARMNERYRKKSGPTDVLSFGAKERRGPMPLRTVRTGEKKERDKRGDAQGAEIRREKRLGLRNERGEYLGDIAISPAAAQRNARRFGRSLSSEVRILILHGILHVLGYDHVSDRGEMERLERRLRKRLGLS